VDGPRLGAPQEVERHGDDQHDVEQRDRRQQERAEQAQPQQVAGDETDAEQDPQPDLAGENQGDDRIVPDQLHHILHAANAMAGNAEWNPEKRRDPRRRKG
jgi:hypothetical protein